MVPGLKHSGHKLPNGITDIPHLRNQMAAVNVYNTHPVGAGAPLAGTHPFHPRGSFATGQLDAPPESAHYGTHPTAIHSGEHLSG